MAEYEVYKGVDIPEGSYSGEIVKIEQRKAGKNNEYTYTDLSVSFEVNGEKATLKYSVPSNVSHNSYLGKLFVLFGADLNNLDKVNDNLFLNKRVSFLVSKNERGYSDIVTGTMKPEVKS